MPSVAQIVANIFPIFTVNSGFPKRIIEFRGTGFFVAPRGIFLTAQHVLDRNLAKDESFHIMVEEPYQSEKFSFYRVLDFERDTRGFDLAIGRADFNNSSRFILCKGKLTLGEPLYTYGFPLTEGERRPDGLIEWKLNPRYFQGYLTRDLLYDHPGYKPTPSYELSFPAPVGLSGSPLLQLGTMSVAGVIYGNLESYTITDERQVDVHREQVVTETRKIIQFGLAHFHMTLLGIHSTLLDGKTLGDWVL